jgi:putative ABC transport system permease protein
LGDIAFFTHAILAAVLFMLLTLTANTMRQSIEERTSEFGVLKALGFTGGQCLRLAFVEAATLCIAAAALGLVLASIGAPLARDISETINVSGTVFLEGAGLAVLLAIASVALPAWRLYRLSVVDSLAVHA